jgi:hypothetical protein
MQTTRLIYQRLTLAKKDNYKENYELGEITNETTEYEFVDWGRNALTANSVQLLSKRSHPLCNKPIPQDIKHSERWKSQLLTNKAHGSYLT